MCGTDKATETKRSKKSQIRELGKYSELGLLNIWQEERNLTEVEPIAKYVRSILLTVEERHIVLCIQEKKGGGGAKRREGLSIHVVNSS